MIELSMNFPKIEGLKHLDEFPDDVKDAAAVIMLFINIDDEFHLLFTKRSENLRSHKGQVSFPGGHRDPGESTPVVTALRECYEEVGLKSEGIKILGALDKVISHKGKEVFPVVGIYSGDINDVVASEFEIDEVFTAPWEMFQVGLETNYPINFKGQKYITKSYRFKKWTIWGLTAQIIFNSKLKKKKPNV